VTGRPNARRLPRAFFDRPTVTVARELLGQRLVHISNGQRLAGLITEAEAYVGQADLACHARVGHTPRTAVMFGPPGHAYVYFTYGMHWLLNCVTEQAGFPAAVLLRAIAPAEGVTLMRRRRGRVPEARLTDGPAKLTQALGIDGRFNGHDLCARGAQLFIERAALPGGAQVIAGPRVGMGSTPEPWHSMPWNFRLASDSA
jgi:DNA-3-methyladenine glycosylase